MAGYIYIAILAVLLSYTIIRDVLMFKNGNYYPYVLKRGKGELPFIVRLGTTLFIFIGGAVFASDIKILHGMLYVFIVYSVCLALSASTLNYLSYLRSKDHSIIIQTIILDIVIICVSTGVWRFVIQ